MLKPAVRGMTAREVRATQLGPALALEPDIAVVVAGVNDVLRPRFDREAIAADRLGEHEVRPGDLVSIWPWLLHRHKRLWERPDEFDLDRFAPERRGERHRFQFIPFGAGPRMCVGARLAMSEALSLLAVWLAQWRFEPLPGHEVRASGSVTLRPAGGMPLILNERR